MSGREEKDKCSAFLYLIGQDGREVFNTMTFDGDTRDKIEPLFTKFKEYCQPHENTIVWRHKFNTKVQGKGETIDQYVTELRTISKNCRFGLLTDELIRDRIVCGVNSEKLKERLLRDGELTLIRAITTCRASEESHHMMKNLHGEEVVASVKKSRDYKKTSHKPTPQSSKQYKRVETPRHSNLCGQCGGQHMKGNCPAFGKKCLKCQKLNHFTKCCRTKNPGRVHNVENSAQDETDTLFIGSVESSPKHDTEFGRDEVFVNLKLCQVSVKFKVDTGSQANLIPLKTVQKLRPTVKVEKSKVTLTSYTGDKMCYTVQGQSVRFLCHRLNTYSVARIRSSQDLEVIKVVLTTNTERKDPVDMYPKLFEGLGCLKESYKIQIDESVTPVVNAPRNVPAALRDRLKDALSEMERDGIIEKVDQPTDWVSSLVVVEKPSGKLRVCLDPRNLNVAIKREHYQLPTIEDIVSRMSNAKYFSKLDANRGYWQVALDMESQKLTTFNTPFGRYCYTRMPFGIKSAQEVFQKRMSQHFDGIQGVETDIDDILVWGASLEEHDRNLQRALDRCQEIGLTLNKEKCKFRQTEVSYIGHRLTQQGVHPDPSKIEAVKDMPQPIDKKGVERLLGFVNYLSKFIPNMSTVTEPIRRLLKSDVEFEWAKPQEEAFKEIKKRSSPGNRY
ncbi:uncharacterized protein K02A2.6-like [Mizuhopecten yessoensis]|uniref:uncharacterized protein K02A2.6-like n=1 Tax=Mizuhopecten yessoensis TaxID=6573 RepID=UPI000B45BF2D|nr:uncharacterized protein K02A2.6-like [Mizuhopecten yessoensis]